MKKYHISGNTILFLNKNQIFQVLSGDRKIIFTSFQAFVVSINKMKIVIKILFSYLFIAFLKYLSLSGFKIPPLPVVRQFIEFCDWECVKFLALLIAFNSSFRRFLSLSLDEFCLEEYLPPSL